MEPEVTVNWTAFGSDILDPCYKVDNFHHTMKITPSIMCVLSYIFLVLLTAITICGNLLVIISIIYFKQLHTPANYLILSLAVTDLLVGIILIPYSLTVSLSSCLYYDNPICKFFSSFDSTLTTCSILNLFCISVDRYYAVCQPLTYRTKISDRVVLIMILMSWGVSALTGICFLISALNSEKCEEMCGTLVFAESNLVIYLNLIGLIASFYLPVIIVICMFCIYMKIFIVAQRQVRSIQNTTCQSTKSGATVSKMERKATKTLAIVLGVFLLCWIPYYLYLTIVAFSKSSVHVSFPVYVSFNMLTLSNSMLNPFIYAFFYSWFRSAFRMIISGKIFQGDFMTTQLQ